MPLYIAILVISIVVAYFVGQTAERVHAADEAVRTAKVQRYLDLLQQSSTAIENPDKLSQPQQIKLANALAAILDEHKENK